MGVTFGVACQAVRDHLAREGYVPDVVAYHEAAMSDLAAWLAGEGIEGCRPEDVWRWIEAGSERWPWWRLRSFRAAAGKIARALESGELDTPATGTRAFGGVAKELGGWSLRAVEAYGGAMLAEGCAERSVYVAKLHAAQFLVASGLADAAAGDVTAAAIVAYCAEGGSCEGSELTAAQKVVHVRGFLERLASAGEVPEWAPMLARRRLPGGGACLVPVDWPDVDGTDPGRLLAAVGGLADALRAEGYADTAVETAGTLARQLYVALSLGGARYTRANAEAWLDAASDRVARRMGEWSRALAQLDSWLERGTTPAVPAGPGVAERLGGMPAWARPAVGAYLELCLREGRAEGTVATTRLACARLASYADACGCGSWADLDAATVAAWCAEDPHGTPGGRACYVTRARGLLEHLESEGEARPGVSLACASGCAPRTVVVEVLTDDQVAAIEGARRSASTPLELRDAAMIALGLTMGLRASDVVALEASDIRWGSSSVTVVQRKTLEQVDLPLTVPAGNAILAWLRGGRPSGTGSRLVFLRLRAPHGPLGVGSCKDAMRRTLGEGAPPFHALRRTFATRMLRSGSRRSSVAEALGHRGEASVAPYLALDEERMRMCALSPSDVGIGGGAR